MKKRLVSFLLVLVLALGLCAGASAAPVWTVADGALSLSGLGEGQYAFAVWYGADGQYLGVQVLNANGALHPAPGAAKVKLICTGHDLAPLDVSFTLPRGNGYRVRKTDSGQVELYCQGPGGVAVSRPVTEKISGRFVDYSDKYGKLCVGGKYYSGTHLPVDGCKYTVTQADIPTWSSQPDVLAQDTFDFWLDPWGNICWAELVKEYHYQVNVCPLLSVELTEDNVVRAELMYFTGSVFYADVSRLSSEFIADPAAAVEKLRASIPEGFYGCTKERDGTYSMSLMEGSLSDGWERPVSIPAGTVTAPAANFTQSDANYVADDKTLFIVTSSQNGQEVVTRYTGFQDLPALTVAEGSVYTVYYPNNHNYPVPKARLVYLRAAEG